MVGMAPWTSTFRRFVAVALALGITFALLGEGGPAVARAADPVEQARGLMEEGQSLFKLGKYGEAMAKFEAAYQTHAAAAFLYNAAFAAEKSGDLKLAIKRYNMYLAAEPDSPYAKQVRERIEKLEAELAAPPPPEPDGGEGGGASSPPDEKPDAATIAELPSLVRVMSDPPGAPILVFEKVGKGAKPFVMGEGNPGWRKIVAGVQTPKELSLKVGSYHVVIEKFREFNESGTSLELAPGHVYTYKASLSQGAFQGALLLRTNIEHARIYVNDPPPHRSAPMQRGPGTLTLPTGEHEVWVEAPGYQTRKETVTIARGETAELDVRLERVDFGYLVIDGDAGEITIAVDGKPQPTFSSRGDPVRLELPAGEHQLMLDADGRKTFEGKVEVPKGQELPVHATMVASYPRAKAFVLGGFAIGAAVGGVFLHLEAIKPVGQPHDEAAHQAFNVTRFVAWGASGLLAGLAIFYAVYDPLPDSYVRQDPTRELTEESKDEAKEAALRPVISPWFSPRGGGLGVGLQF